MLLASALGSSTAIVAYLALFAGIGFAFIFVNLLVGRFLRPHDPHEEKQEIYECGEPPIGSSFVQFDLRFYVVALVFIIFDVEIAFLFPWATVFGKATSLKHQKAAVVMVVDGVPELAELTPHVASVYREMGVRQPPIFDMGLREADQAVRKGATDLATLALIAGLIFFAVLFVGFAYEWKTGALDWVRAIRSQHHLPRRWAPTGAPATKSTPQESVLSA